MFGFPALLNQTVTIYNQNSQNRHGEDAYSAGAEVKARFVPKTRTILQPNGVVIQTDGVCYVKPETVVAVNDKITFGGATYKVVGKDAGVNRDGSTHHWTLKVALWR